MGKYKMQRTSLQFDKKFVDWLDEKLKGQEAKNQYIMKKCGYTKEVTND
jgi:hypothetical protein